MQGFQTPIQNDSFVVDGMGALGRTHTERGLTFYEVALSGHMCVIDPSSLWSELELIGAASPIKGYRNSLLR